MTAHRLPDSFHDLERHLEWALPTEQERSAKRQISDIAELETFYNAMLPRMEEILPFLSKYPLGDVPSDVECLLHLSFALAEIAPAVENFGQASVIDGYDVARFHVQLQ